MVVAALILAGRYEKLRNWQDNRWRKLKSFDSRSRFHMLACEEAGASLGLRAFEEASRHLNRGEQLASELVDPRLWGSIQSVKALTLLAQGD